MDHPSKLLRRARQRRTQAAPKGGATAPAPAPVAPAPAPAEATPEAAVQPAVPQAVRRSGSHALYNEVMKRHDRMSTRHL